MSDTQVWGLTTFQLPGTTQDHAGIQLASGEIRQPELLKPFRGLIEAVAQWTELAPQLQSLDITAAPVVSGAIAVAPLRFPRKLICAGANYHDHLAEMGAPDVPPGCEPFFFFLPPTTTLVASGDVVEIPAGADARVDWEAEMAIIIGRSASNISEEEAPLYVAGYAPFNDITARGYHKRAASIAPPFAFDWCLSKGLDGFCPMGPIVPSWQISDPHDVGVRCTVNGEVKQDGRTQDMIFNLWKLLSYASKHWTLEPGDIIATGTPAGVGARTGTFLRDGDEVIVDLKGWSSVKSTIRCRSSIAEPKVA